jgi:hypothetical protein
VSRPCGRCDCLGCTLAPPTGRRLEASACRALVLRRHRVCCSLHCVPLPGHRSIGRLRGCFVRWNGDRYSRGVVDGASGVCQLDRLDQSGLFLPFEAQLRTKREPSEIAGPISRIEGSSSTLGELQPLLKAASMTEKLGGGALKPPSPPVDPPLVGNIIIILQQKRRDMKC